MPKKLAVLFGVVFVLVGILGFIPNPLVGAGSLFEADTMHNLVHFIIGVILLAVAMMAPMKSGMWLKIIGVVYVVLAILGFLMVPQGGSLLGLVATNAADHWLHIVLGVVIFLAGYAPGAGTSSASMPTSMPMS